MELDIALGPIQGCRLRPRHFGSTFVLLCDLGSYPLAQSDHRCTSIRFPPGGPASWGIEAKGVRVDVTNDLDEEITEKGESALIAALRGKYQLLVIFLRTMDEMKG